MNFNLNLNFFANPEKINSEKSEFIKDEILVVNEFYNQLRNDDILKKENQYEIIREIFRKKKLSETENDKEIKLIYDNILLDLIDYQHELFQKEFESLRQVFKKFEIIKNNKPNTAIVGNSLIKIVGGDENTVFQEFLQRFQFIMREEYEYVGANEKIVNLYKLFALIKEIEITETAKRFLYTLFCNIIKFYSIDNNVISYKSLIKIMKAN